MCVCVCVCVCVRARARHRYSLIAIACPPGRQTALASETERMHLTNSVALVRERIIPTERPPLVGEVSANFSG
jgi:hypothetical protein